MKRRPSCCAGVYAMMYLFLVTFLCSSCVSYYFSRPQPVDRKNRHHFPKAFRGSWYGKESKTTTSFSIDYSYDSAGRAVTKIDSIEESVAVADEEHHDDDSGALIVYRKFVHYINISKEKIDKGIQLKIDSGKNFQYLKDDSNIFGTVHYDSLGRPVDTTATYLLRQNLIYRIDENTIDKGYPFDSIPGKEIVVLKTDTTTFDLGRNYILRRLNRKFWVFNMFAAGTGKHMGWWTIIILEKGKHGTMRMWDIGEKSESLPCMFYRTGEWFTNNYFDCKWSAGKMLQLLHDGYFNASEWCRL